MGKQIIQSDDVVLAVGWIPMKRARSDSRVLGTKDYVAERVKYSHEENICTQQKTMIFQNWFLGEVFVLCASVLATLASLRYCGLPLVKAQVGDSREGASNAL